MPRDQRLYTTFPNDDALTPFHHSAAPDAYVYVVTWDQDDDGRELVKVGYTHTPARWRRLVQRGGIVRLVVRAPWDVALALESHVHDALVLEPAGFLTKEESIDYLGPGGSGWVECYRTSLSGVLSVIEGVIGDAVVQG
ncbi:hypothetical protein [Microbacterium binotii]|uniref:GIY-YIG nuclease family protein n=1 Tax=Microbacterium binotii TaxID=462710 RepID=A0ABP6BMI4_9MICO